MHRLHNIKHLNVFYYKKMQSDFSISEWERFETVTNQNLVKNLSEWLKLYQKQCPDYQNCSDYKLFWIFWVYWKIRSWIFWFNGDLIYQKYLSLQWVLLLLLLSWTIRVYFRDLVLCRQISHICSKKYVFCLWIL